MKGLRDYNVYDDPDMDDDGNVDVEYFPIPEGWGDAWDEVLAEEKEEETRKAVSSKPLITIQDLVALKKGGPSPAEIHELADRLGVVWDDDPKFKAFSLAAVGVSHIDEMTPAQRESLARQLATQVRDGGSGLTLKKAGLFIVKAQRPAGSGWMIVPKGRKGGYRRRKGKDWEYWYPSAEAAKPKKKRKFEWGESKYTEEQFESGDFDKNPKRWHVWSRPGLPPEGWTDGGVVIDSKHPVKEAGRAYTLYQIQDANAEPGWAQLKDVSTGKTKLVQHFNVVPVYWPKKTVRKPVDVPTISVSDVPKPPSVSGVSEGAQRLPVFANSRAKKGTALFKMENGYFVRKSVTEFEQDRAGNNRRVKGMRVDVDPQTKEKLLAEFRGLLAKESRDAQKAFGLKSRWLVERGARKRDEALVDVRMSAMEGFLTGVERYEATGPFSAYIRPWVRSFARAQAAADASGGFTLSRRKKRILLSYTAARARAVSGLDMDDPSPSQVAAVWRLRKRDVHNMGSDDPHRNHEIPMGDYTLKVARRGTKHIIDTKTQPGKLSLATDIHEYLTAERGLRGSGFLGEEEATLPGVHMGVGLTEKERLEIRDSISKAAEGMDAFEVTLGEGRQSTRYRVNAVDLIKDAFGISGDAGTTKDMQLPELSERAKIERKVGDEYVPVSTRGKYRIVEQVLEQALSHLRGKLSDETPAGSLVIRASEELSPRKEIKRGPTYHQVLESRARKVDIKEIRDWRSKERIRLRSLRDRIRSRVTQATSDKDREHQLSLASGTEGAIARISRMGNREVALRIAHEAVSRATDFQRKLMTSSVAVDPVSPDVEYGTSIVTLTDLASGRQRRARIRTFRDLTDPASAELTNPFLKSENVEDLESGVVLDMARFPRVMQLLWRDDPLSTVDRFVVESLAGLH